MYLLASDALGVSGCTTPPRTDPAPPNAGRCRGHRSLSAAASAELKWPEQLVARRHLRERILHHGQLHRQGRCTLHVLTGPARHGAAEADRTFGEVLERRPSKAASRPPR